MLHILLLILKIIGILLLCLLGVLFLCIVCMLFVPVRYRIEALREEGEGKPPVVLQVKVTWLLHFVNMALRFDGSLFLRARLMIFTLFRLPKKEKKHKGRGRKKAEEQKYGETGTAGTLEEQDEKREIGTDTDESVLAEQKTAPESAADKTMPDNRPGQVQESVSDAENTGDRPDESTEAYGEESGEKLSFWDKLRAIPEILRGIFIKIKSFFENIQYTIQKFCDKIKSVSDTIEYYRNVIEGEAFQRSFALCKGELVRIGKSLKPQKFQARLVVGMDDPAATGQILAVCGMLYPLIGGHVDVVGDFEKKRLEGHVFVKGKIRFFTFLRVAVKVYFNKDIRKLYKLLKKEAV